MNGGYILVDISDYVIGSAIETKKFNIYGIEKVLNGKPIILKCTVKVQDEDDTYTMCFVMNGYKHRDSNYVTLYSGDFRTLTQGEDLDIAIEYDFKKQELTLDIAEG